VWSEMVSSGLVATLLDTKPHRGALIARLPYEVETQLMFVLRNVNMGQQRRYQQWFAQKWVSLCRKPGFAPSVVSYAAILTAQILSSEAK
jgi:Integrator complex subunit 3 N-terminal